jgi:glycosyltransferase involved in cell wall biosynthesis
MISIVIPAHNEHLVIERCLSSILEDAGPEELEVAVVCNGCTDDTAAKVRKLGDPRVTVVETPVGSKIHALNLGDQAVSGFPRLYVDADVELGVEAIREVATLLGDGSPIVVAAPRAKVAYQDRPWFLRSFYRVWTRLPYFSENMIGAGVYAFSREGRSRFGEFPNVTADDEYARLIAAPDERKSTESTTFTIHPPRTLGGLLKILTRARAARYELADRFPRMGDHGNTGANRTLRTLVTSPSMWADAPIYLGITFWVIQRAKKKMRQKQSETVWERDDSSRN